MFQSNFFSQDRKKNQNKKLSSFCTRMHLKIHFFVCSIADHMQLLLLCNEKDFKEFGHYKVFSVAGELDSTGSQKDNNSRWNHCLISPTPPFRLMSNSRRSKVPVQTEVPRNGSYTQFSTGVFSSLNTETLMPSLSYVLLFFSLNQCLQKLEIECTIRRDDINNLRYIWKP